MGYRRHRADRVSQGFTALATSVVLVSGCFGSGELGLHARNGVPTTPGDGDGVDVPAVLPDGPACTPDVAWSPLRRLNRREYNHSVLDVLGIDDAPADVFVSDEVVGGFAANSVAPISELQVEDYLAAAERMSSVVVDRLIAEPDACDWSQDACVAELLERLSTRLFRRPPDAQTHDELMGLYAVGRTQWDARTGVRMAVELMLTSPRFLYHLEAPVDAATGTLVARDGFDVAARLSYFLWQSAPDEVLLQAAASGTLATADGVETQSRRMLADPRADRVLASFHEQWLQIESLPQQTKDETLFPEWGEGVGRALQEDTRAFVVDVFRHGDATLASLLTGRHAFVTADTAPLYGVPAPVGGARAKVALPPERAGLLTHPAFLSAHAHTAETSWVMRGRFVREQLLCGVIPPPPPSVDMDTTNDPDRLTNPSCSGCHRLMDPIGQGFESFDAAGRFLGTPASGEILSASPELEGGFSDVIDLATRTAQSQTVQACLTRQWMRFATGREESAADSCTLQSGEEALRASGGDLRELLVSLSHSPAFRLRRTAP